jgi:NADPH2:quinone reductase
LRLFLIYEISASDRKASIDELTQLLQSGRLVHTIAGRFPLQAIAEAHEILESGDVMGNVVLDVC